MSASSSSSSSSSMVDADPMKRALSATNLTSLDNLDVLHRLLQTFLTHAEVVAVRKTHPTLARMGEARTLHMKRGGAVYAALRAGQRHIGRERHWRIDDIFAQLFHRLGTHDTYALLGTSNVFGEAYDADGRFEHDILDDHEWIRSLLLCNRNLWHMPELVAKFKAMFQTAGKPYAQLMQCSLDFVDRLRADQLPHQLRANIPFVRLEPFMRGLRDQVVAQSDHFAEQKQFTVCDVFMFALDTFVNAAAPVRFGAPPMATLEDLDAAQVLTEFWVLHPEHVPYAYARVVQERHAEAAAAAAAANAANAEMKDDATAAAAVPRIGAWESLHRPANKKPGSHMDPMDEN
jgi:hypothetical protein